MSVESDSKFDPKVDEPGMERRRFLRVMGAGAAGVAVAAPLLGTGPAEAAETPDQRVRQRYRETDHVKKYYETNRF